MEHTHPMQSLTASEATYHKLCFKCAECKTTLSLKNTKELAILFIVSLTLDDM